MLGHSSEKKRRILNRKKFRIGCKFTGPFYTQKYDDSPNMSPKYSKLRPIWNLNFFCGTFAGNSTFPNACGEALLAKREFMARAEGECRNEFR